MLDIRNLTINFGARSILRDLNLSIAQGSWVGIIGPNGAGKTTLLRSISRTLTPNQGQVVLLNKDLYKDLSPIASARLLAVVPQQTSLSFDLTVRDLVLMGRMPHLGRFERESQKDYEIVDRVLKLTGTAELADQSFLRLSGGQQQLVAIARALAQEPQLLLLDEPTSHLDVRHQVCVMDVLRSLSEKSGLTIVSVLHDLNLAALYCDYLALVSNGSIAAFGIPEEVLQEKLLREVYQCPIIVSRHPLLHKPQVHLVPQSFAQTS